MTADQMFLISKRTVLFLAITVQVIFNLSPKLISNSFYIVIVKNPSSQGKYKQQLLFRFKWCSILPDFSFTIFCLDRQHKAEEIKCVALLPRSK